MQQLGINIVQRSYLISEYDDVFTYSKGGKEQLTSMAPPGSATEKRRRSVVNELKESRHREEEEGTTRS